MLSYALQQYTTNSNKSSIFPPLIGSHRKLKTEPIGKYSPDNKLSNSPILSPSSQQKQKDKQKEVNQASFLNRMKKARDIILSHQRRNKFQAILDLDSEKSHSKKRNQSSLNSNQKSFSNVVYNLGTPKSQTKKKITTKKQSFGQQNFNDKILRQCKSQFMPTQSQKKKHKVNFFHRKQQNTVRVQQSATEPLFIKQNPQQYSETQLRKNREDKKLYIKSLFDEQIIDSSGSELIQKLRLCFLKNKNDNSLEKHSNGSKQNIRIKLKQEVQKQIPQQIVVEENNNENIPHLHHPSFKFKHDASKKKTKYFLNKRESIRKYFDRKNQHSNNDGEQQIQECNIDQKTQMYDYDGKCQSKAMKAALDGIILVQQKQQKLQKQGIRKGSSGNNIQLMKNQSKSANFDFNFKIEGWDPKQAYPQYNMD